jgi:hypothetical protein
MKISFTILVLLATAATAQQRTPEAIDHVVPHISTAHANRGDRVSLFMRERRRA